MHQTIDKHKIPKEVHKLFDFGRQLFASVLRSRTGSLSEMSILLRFQKGTKGFERMYEKLLPLINEIKDAFKKVLLENFPSEGIRLAIFDDTDIKKAGKTFPKQQIHHNHSDNSFFSGMKVLSSAIYQNGKTAVVNSVIVGKDDNKLEVAKNEVDKLIIDFFVEVFLFDAWYCKNPDEPKDVVKNWLRNKNTLEFLGLWERINNSTFKGVEFDSFML